MPSTVKREDVDSWLALVLRYVFAILGGSILGAQGYGLVPAPVFVTFAAVCLCGPLVAGSFASILAAWRNSKGRDDEA